MPTTDRHPIEVVPHCMRLHEWIAPRGGPGRRIAVPR
jgi:hypothetical protein